MVRECVRRGRSWLIRSSSSPGLRFDGMKPIPRLHRMKDRFSAALQGYVHGMGLAWAATRALSLALDLAVASPGLALPADAATPTAGTEAWFALHVFMGTGGCLVVRAGQRLQAGDRVLV